MKATTPEDPRKPLLSKRKIAERRYIFVLILLSVLLTAGGFYVINLGEIADAKYFRVADHKDRETKKSTSRHCQPIVRATGKPARPPKH